MEHHNHFWGIWWLIFPGMWFALAIMGMALGHRRRQAAIDLLRTYAAQGKEPPAEILAMMRDRGRHRHRYYGHGGRGGMPRGILLGFLAAAFGLLSYLGLDPSGDTHDFTIAAVILAALSGASLVMALTRPRERELPELDVNPPHGK